MICWWWDYEQTPCGATFRPLLLGATPRSIRVSPNRFFHQGPARNAQNCTHVPTGFCGRAENKARLFVDQKRSFRRVFNLSENLSENHEANNFWFVGRQRPSLTKTNHHSSKASFCGQKVCLVCLRHTVWHERTTRMETLETSIRQIFFWGQNHSSVRRGKSSLSFFCSYVSATSVVANENVLDINIDMKYLFPETNIFLLWSNI